MSIETPRAGGAASAASGRRRTLVVLTAASVAVSLTGAAWAPSRTATRTSIHGCYSQDGALRVIDPSSSDRKLRECTSKETAITWNQEGPRGEPGPAGVRTGAGRPGTGRAGRVQPGPGLLSGYQRYERSFDRARRGDPSSWRCAACPNERS